MDETLTRTRSLAFILKAGTFAALLATLISALLIAVLSTLQPLVQTTPLKVLDVIKATILLIPITVVSYGSYGFLAGVLGISILKWRKSRIRSTRRLVVESAVVGFILGFLFPLFDRLMNPPSLWGEQVLFFAPTGVCCAILCALTFRTYLVTPPSPIP